MTEVLVRTRYAFQRAQDDQILALPAPVRKGLPSRKIIGILADAEQVLAWMLSERRAERSFSSFCLFFACLPSKIEDEHEHD
jgi:hypothetical protein